MNADTMYDKNSASLHKGPLAAAGTLLGLGMGGFIDGIILHQVLQWHEMLSFRVKPDTLLNKSINMFWDGIFHVVTWLFTAAGIWLLWRVSRRKDVLLSNTLFSGGLLLGWGLFNFVEGIIDHYLLRLHNVKESSPDPLIWNHGFMVFAIILLVAGYMLVQRPGKHQVG